MVCLEIQSLTHLHEQVLSQQEVSLVLKVQLNLDSVNWSILDLVNWSILNLVNWSVANNGKTWQLKKNAHEITYVVNLS